MPYDYTKTNEYKYLKTCEYFGRAGGIPQITCPRCDYSDSILLCSVKLVQREECEFIEFHCPNCHEMVKRYTEGMWSQLLTD